MRGQIWAHPFCRISLPQIDLVFDYLGDIGIVPIFFNEMYYCRECKEYVEECEYNSLDVLSISETECRAMLESKICPPDWFLRKDISNLILNRIKKGEEVFVK